MRALALALALSLALVAGCFNKEEVPDGRSFAATGGVVSPGWAYDGVGLSQGAASLQGSLLDSANTGSATVAFEFGGERWVATFDRFAQAEGRAFMDGGVEFELDEHGDTGVADASIPKIHAKVAAWGTGRVERDGALATPEPWSAHLMLSADTVRGTDGKIAKADGATPYDPSAPADARRIEGDPQALFWIKHPQGETFARPPANVSTTLTCTGPECVVQQELDLEEGAATIDLNLTLFGPDPGLPFGPVGEGTIRLLDANGTELANAAVAPAPAGAVTTPLGAIDLSAAVLPLILQLEGAGAFSVSATGAATYDDVPFLVVTWDEYELTDA